MGFWTDMPGIEMLLPLIMIVFGYLFARKAPDKINRLYGYRTRRSMMNMDTWSYAHRYLGRLWLVTGMVMLVVTVIMILLAMRFDEDKIDLAAGVITGLQMIPLIGSLFLAESELKKTFDESGRRK